MCMNWMMKYQQLNNEHCSQVANRIDGDLDTQSIRTVYTYVQDTKIRLYATISIDWI